MGFNAAWFAKAASCVLVALAVGFFGSLYFGAKLLGPVDETMKLETRSNQSIAAQTKAYIREPANAQAQNNIEPRSTPEVVHPPVSTAAPASRSLPFVERDVTEPQDQAARDTLVTRNHGELRLGQQERRRLRAERTKSLENANASLQRRPKKLPREDARDEPFFPFRF